PLGNNESEQEIAIQEQIAEILMDYELAPLGGMNSTHVGRWVEQFEESDKLFILEQTLALLRNAYISKNDYVEKINDILRRDYNCSIIRRSAFLSIQDANRGASQRDLLELLETQAEEFAELDIVILSRTSTNQQVEEFNEFIYFDDVCFSGSKALSDITWFVEHYNLSNVTIRVCFLGTHRYATYMLETNLAERFQGRNITFFIKKNGFLKTRENRLRYSSSSEVFWLRRNGIELPDWIQHPEIYTSREGTERTHFRANDIFPNRADRYRFEYALTKAGFYILQQSQNPAPTLKPLGFSTFSGLGFGGTIFTYRNCPNNTPLAFWWGRYEHEGIPSWALDCWYPLMRRIGYNQ
ncbi:phosphoribosyltransferase-like protein, partial [Serratia marcescens]